jgi:hypothetical protein
MMGNLLVGLIGLIVGGGFLIYDRLMQLAGRRQASVVRH